MANRSDRASVKTDGSVRRGLPQVYRRANGVKQFYGLSQTLS